MFRLNRWVYSRTLITFEFIIITNTKPLHHTLSITGLFCCGGDITKYFRGFVFIETQCAHMINSKVIFFVSVSPVCDLGGVVL